MYKRFFELGEPYLIYIYIHIGICICIYIYAYIHLDTYSIIYIYTYCGGYAAIPVLPPNVCFIVGELGIKRW